MEKVLRGEIGGAVRAGMCARSKKVQGCSQEEPQRIRVDGWGS